jgi:hypothetical protein
MSLSYEIVLQRLDEYGGLQVEKRDDPIVSGIVLCTQAASSRRIAGSVARTQTCR